MNLRIVNDKNDKENVFFIAAGEGPTYKCLAAALSLSAARTLLAEIKKNPYQWGI